MSRDKLKRRPVSMITLRDEGRNVDIRLLRYWVITPGVERLTTENSAECEPATF
jgi:hypothetical protein